MKNYLFPIYLVTGFLLVYAVAIYLDLYLPLILFLFSISPLLLIWMVYKVLTADVEVKNTFDD